jgi:hypothetical protein
MIEGIRTKTRTGYPIGTFGNDKGKGEGKGWIPD